jgi:hypothetical protein
LGVLMFSNKGSFFSRDELIGLFLLLEYTERYDRAVLQLWKERGWSQFRWHPLNPVRSREQRWEKHDDDPRHLQNSFFFFFLFFYRPGPIRWKL